MLLIVDVPQEHYTYLTLEVGVVRIDAFAIL